MLRRAHRLLWIVGKVCQRVAKLVRKLKVVLCPIGALGRQTDCNGTIRTPCEICLRMIVSVINGDAREPCMRTMPQDFAHCGFENSLDVRTTDPPKPRWLHSDAGPLRRPMIFSGVGEFAKSKAQRSDERQPRGGSALDDVEQPPSKRLCGRRQRRYLIDNWCGRVRHHNKRKC